MKQYYKLARPDGFDFFTGQTINYREGIGKIIKCPNGDRKKGLCSSGVIHASENPNDCFVGAKTPCSAYLIEGKPVIKTMEKCGFLEMRVLSEITDLDSLFGWKYSEVINPINPFLIKTKKPTKSDIALLKHWDSIRDSVRGSVWDSIWAYTGSMFPNIKKWKYINHKEGIYPYQPCVDLWKRGFVPSFDGQIWRLHSGKDAKVVYTLDKKDC